MILYYLKLHLIDFLFVVFLIKYSNYYLGVQKLLFLPLIIGDDMGYLYFSEVNLNLN